MCVCVCAACCAGEEAWKKLEHMRDQRKRILKKVKDSQKSGAGTDEVYKPNVWWFDAVSFLDVSRDKPTVDNLSQVIVMCCLCITLIYSGASAFSNLCK